MTPIRQDNNFKYGAILLTTCLISSLALSLVYKMTSGAVLKTAAENFLILQREALPTAESFRGSAPEADVNIGLDAKGAVVGKTATASARGYGGDVALIVGVDLKGTVVSVKALSHKETPGLGTKALTPEYLSQYAGKKADKIKLKKDDPSVGALDAVTGATITSRAVSAAVGDALIKAASSER
ncbi:MAG: FMN-binding protein [Endomicrobiia bacterium]|nr:FMN-binding protein [Endomicrobiia bacterium]